MFFIRLTIAILTLLACALSFAARPLGIHGPERVGVVTDRPFLYLIPATGGNQLRYSAQGLPSGLALNTETGIITGSTVAEGEYNVRFMVSDESGSVSKNINFTVGKKAIALTPPMGWNPWYVWGCKIDDAKIREAADLLVSTGLASVGYNYINLDDCWQGKRNEKGEMVPNKNFPDMKALADYVHSKGLRIGMYTGPGPKTCGGYEATKDHDFEKGVSFLEIDVNTYARWGFDFIKYDWCIFPSDPKIKEYYMSKQITLYQRMSEAIERSSRSMVHMLCQYGENNVWDWAPAIGGNMWRTNHDLADTWPAVLRNGFENLKLSSYAGPGHWNDLDMLIIGKANWPKKLGDYDISTTEPRPTQLTTDEQLTHMTLWSMMASPLLFSSDLKQLDEFTLGLLTNTDMIAVNQDALGAPIKIVREADNSKIISRALNDGSLAVAVFNLNTTSVSIKLDPKELGLVQDQNYSVKNVWTGETTNSLPESLEVKGHGTYFVRINRI